MRTVCRYRVTKVRSLEAVVRSLKEGAEMLYVAMFDEIDEGTAIFKCAKKVPVGASTFVPIEEGIGSDHYLWLVGRAGKMLRKEILLEMKQPVR